MVIRSLVKRRSSIVLAGGRGCVVSLYLALAYRAWVGNRYGRACVLGLIQVCSVFVFFVLWFAGLIVLYGMSAIRLREATAGTWEVLPDCLRFFISFTLD